MVILCTVGKRDLGITQVGPTYREFDTLCGYYNAAEDYFTHSIGAAPLENDIGDDPAMVIFGGIDFRNNTAKPVTDKNGMYSTKLFTEAVEQVIMNRGSDTGPFFIYAAYQSVHTPLEAVSNTLINVKIFLMISVITDEHFVGC